MRSRPVFSGSSIKPHPYVISPHFRQRPLRGSVSVCRTMEGNAQQSEEKRETHPVSGVVVTSRDVKRVPKSVLGCTIAATVNAGFVLAFVVAYIVVRKVPKNEYAANQAGTGLSLRNNSAFKAVITLPVQIAVLVRTRQ